MTLEEFDTEYGVLIGGWVKAYWADDDDLMNQASDIFDKRKEELLAQLDEEGHRLLAIRVAENTKRQEAECPEIFKPRKMPEKKWWDDLNVWTPEERKQALNDTSPKAMVETMTEYFRRVAKNDLALLREIYEHKLEWLGSLQSKTQLEQAYQCRLQELRSLN